jgi:asparagine synthase (glutamine-hydrolysing)
LCGIVAVFDPAGEVDPDRIRSAVHTLRHRGPDGQRTWVAPHRRVGLGHARLSVIDLASGDQPIANESESMWIVVNGEIYDFERLRGDLERRGHRFRTRSDSEVALHLYEDRGVDMVSELRGELALVLWDENTQTLVAARDRFGIKPLYYASHRGGLQLASEVKALFELGVPTRWDRDAFARAWHAPLPASQTLFEGVRQVPPGHLLIARAGSVRMHRYWDWPAPPSERELDDASERRESEALLAALREAVRVRMRADVPVGVYLSGGVDSSSVLALAAETAHDRVQTWTICFDRATFQASEAYDEESIARGTADLWNADFHAVHVGPGDIAAHFADAVAQSETLHQNGHGAAKYLLARAVRQAGHKVVLTGEGADEVFAGYPWAQLDAIAPLTAATTDVEIDRTLGVVLGAASPSYTPQLHDVRAATTALERSLGFVPWALAVDAWIARVVAPLWRDDMPRLPSDAYAQLVGDDTPPGPPVRRSCRLWVRSALPNYILSVLGDRAEMAHGIEGRVPFLDHHVVELAAGVPVRSLVREDSDKRILRLAMRDRLTDRVYRRRKFGFAVPPSRLGNDPIAAMLLCWLRDVELPFFDRRRVIAFVEGLGLESHEHPVQMSYGIQRIVMQLASACVLQDRYRLG